ncbi:hypothetical protein GGH92_004675, partial [Coemansia sp. RSA 2673]
RLLTLMELAPMKTHPTLMKRTRRMRMQLPRSSTKSNFWLSVLVCRSRSTSKSRAPSPSPRRLLERSVQRQRSRRRSARKLPFLCSARRSARSSTAPKPTLTKRPRMSTPSRHARLKLLQSQSNLPRARRT